MDLSLKIKSSIGHWQKHRESHWLSNSGLAGAALRDVFREHIKHTFISHLIQASLSGFETHRKLEQIFDNSGVSVV